MDGIEVNDTFDDLDAAMASKKRGRELALAEQELNDAQDLGDKVTEFYIEMTCFRLVTRLTMPSRCQKNRGNYRCSRCNIPKKGHVCPFQPRYKRRDQANDVGSGRVSQKSSSLPLFPSF